MSESATPGSGAPRHPELTFDPNDKPHAYDPLTQPDYFAEVRRRRIIAFILDATIVVTLTFAAYIFVLLAGIVTLGLAWLLIGLVFPAVALGYSAYTLSRPESATIGMRLVGLEMRTWYGAPMYALLGAFHTLVFYFSVAILTPLVLLLPLFTARKRCLHDLLCGTVIVNTDEKMRDLRG